MPIKNIYHDPWIATISQILDTNKGIVAATHSCGEKILMVFPWTQWTPAGDDPLFKRRQVQNLYGISHIYVMICIYGIIIIDQVCNISQNLGRSWVIILSFGKAWMLWTLHMFNHRSSFPLLFSPGKRGIPICAVSLFLSFPIQNGGSIQCINGYFRYLNGGTYHI